MVIPRARFTCSMNILGGIFYGVRTHCGIRMAYHTWYLEAGIMYVSILSTFTFSCLVPDAFVVVWCMYDTQHLGNKRKGIVFVPGIMLEAREKRKQDDRTQGPSTSRQAFFFVARG